MTEKSPSHNQLPATPENWAGARVDANVRLLMSSEATILRYQPPETEAEYDADAAIAFGQKLMDWRPTFDEMFEEMRSLDTAAWDHNDARIAEVILGAGPIAEMKRREKEKHPGSRHFKRTFSEYNSVLGDVIRDNPDIAEADLAALAEKGFDWAMMPREEQKRAEARESLKRLFRGASSEEVARQLFEEAGVTYESSSPEDDLKAVDFFVTLSDGKRLLLDIKRSDEQVQSEGYADYTTPTYYIDIRRYSGDHNNIPVLLYVGAKDALEKRKGQLLLDKEDIAPKAAALVQAFEEIALEVEALDEMRELDAKKREVERNLARLAARQQKNKKQ